MNKKLNNLRAAIIMLELKQGYLSFTLEDKRELEKLKREYNTLSKTINVGERRD